MASRFDLEIVIKTKKQGEGVKEAEAGLKSLGDQFKDLATPMNQGLELMGKVVEVGKEVFEMAEEGAALNQLEESFERLNDQVLKTPNLLEDMRAASRGTISDSELMKGVLTLTAGTTDEYARTLAAVSPQLVEMSKASNKLNPLLGDTQFLYESLTTAAKRQSVPIADNLGLVIKMNDATQELHPSLATLADTYDDLTDQQKFLNELLFQGDVLINQVGGSVDSAEDSWARLRVVVDSNVGALKQWMAEGLEPWVKLILGDYRRAIEAAVTGGQTVADITKLSTDEVINQLEQLSEISSLQRVVASETVVQERVLRAELVKRVDTFEEYLDLLGKSESEYTRFTATQLRSDFNRQKAIQRQAEAAEQALAIDEQRAEQAQRRAALTTFTIDTETAAIMEQMQALDEMHLAELRRDDARARADREAEERHEEELERAMLQQQQLERAANRQLELNAHADETFSNQQRISDDLFQAMNDLEAANNGVRGSFDTVAEAIEDAEARISTALSDIRAEHRNMVVGIIQDRFGEEFNESIANALVAMGQLTQEEADFLLATQNVNREINELGEQLLNTFLEDGVLTRQEAQQLETAIRGIEEGAITADDALDELSSGTFPDLISQLDEGTRKVGTLKDELLSLEGDYNATVRINTVGRVANPGGQQATALHHGGRVKAGRPYLVGDGPGGRVLPTSELFVPDRDGTIIPGDLTNRILKNAQSPTPQVGISGTGGGGNTIVNMNVYNQEAGALALAQMDQLFNNKLDEMMGVS